MHISLRELAAFKAVCEVNQLTKAAKTLSLSTPAVSGAIRELEEKLETELFTRTNQGMVPNEAALELLPLAENTLHSAQEIEDLFKERKKGDAGILRIGTDITYGNYVLSRKLPAFKQEHPNVTLRLKVVPNEKVESLVLAGRLDIGFLENKPEDASLENFPCFEDRKCIVVSRTSPLCRIDLTEKDLSSALWFLYEEERLRSDALTWLKENNINAKNSIEMTTLGAIKRAVSTGQGAALLPYLAVKEEFDRGDFIEVTAKGSEASKKNKVYAVYLKKTSPRLRELFFKSCGIGPLK